MRLLRGVTRTVTLTIKDASGAPLDLSAVELTVEVIRDGSGDKYVPTIAVEGEAHNLIVFTWPADKQKVGLHTIDVRGDFGVTGVSRTNWHGPDGIVIVEWARDTSAREVADLSVEEVSMTGTMETAPSAGGSAANAVLYIPQTLTAEQQAQARENIGAGTYSKPASGIPASDLADGVVPKTLHITSWTPTYASGGNDINLGTRTQAAATLGITVTQLDAMMGREYDSVILSGTEDQVLSASAFSDDAVLYTANGVSSWYGLQFYIDETEYHCLALQEDLPTVPEISTDINTDGNSNTKTASPKAVKTYADTKYTKPASGIPASDLASGVIPTVPTISTDIASDATSDTKTASPKAVKTFVEGKGYGTYSKPSGGIPAADLASGVIPTVPTISTDIASDATSDTKTASPKAVKTFVEGKGYGTYSKPSGGIPAADIAAGVIPTVPTISTDIAADKSSTTKIAAPSAVYNEVHPAVESSQPNGGFLPNVVYDLGTITGTVTFALASPTDNTIANPYHWTFETSSTAPTITWPANLTWAGGSAPTISESKHYEIMVRNGYATALEF